MKWGGQSRRTDKDMAQDLLFSIFFFCSRSVPGFFSWLLKAWIPAGFKHMCALFFNSLYLFFPPPSLQYFERLGMITSCCLYVISCLLLHCFLDLWWSERHLWSSWHFVTFLLHFMKNILLRRNTIKTFYKSAAPLPCSEKKQKQNPLMLKGKACCHDASLITLSRQTPWIMESFSHLSRRARKDPGGRQSPSWSRWIFPKARLPTSTSQKLRFGRVRNQVTCFQVANILPGSPCLIWTTLRTSQSH